VRWAVPDDPDALNASCRMSASAPAAQGRDSACVTMAATYRVSICSTTPGAASRSAPGAWMRRTWFRRKEVK
jgi:hypothetical protein